MLYTTLFLQLPTYLKYMDSRSDFNVIITITLTKFNKKHRTKIGLSLPFLVSSLALLITI